MSQLKPVAVSGNLSSPSRTLVLAESILDGIAKFAPIDRRLIQLAELGSALAGARQRKELSPAGEEALAAIESADILVVVSPVYRASYTGLFKHLFDLVGQDALIDTPVILGATGGSERHALVIEHQLRPLLSFFRAHTVPTGIYLTEADFKDYRLENAGVIERIDSAAKQAVELAQFQSSRLEAARAAA